MDLLFSISRETSIRLEPQDWQVLLTNLRDLCLEMYTRTPRHPQEELTRRRVVDVFLRSFVRGQVGRLHSWLAAR